MKLFFLVLTLVVSSKAFFKTEAAPEKAPEPDIIDIFGSNSDDDDEYETTPQSETMANSLSRGCGMRNEAFFKAGEKMEPFRAPKAKFAEFNWAVPIFEVLWNGTESYNSTGSLIHPQVVLTVAHNYNEKKNWLVRPGALNIRNVKYDPAVHHSIYVAEVVKHPLFKPRTLRYDVALLFLATPIDVTSDDYIGFTCLPPAMATVPPSASCIVTGWGQERFSDQTTVDILKMVEVPAVSRADCQETLRDKLGQAFNLHKSFICAGGETGKDACLGDGGGPLVCPYQTSPNQYYQAGIVSWGVDCGQPGVPGVYTNVAEVRQWIDDTMSLRGYGSETYTP